jgi:hypothetical protein
VRGVDKNALSLYGVVTFYRCLFRWFIMVERRVFVGKRESTLFGMIPKMPRVMRINDIVFVGDGVMASGSEQSS